MSIDADLAAAIALAETEADARIQAAVASAQIAAGATEQAATTQAVADTSVAQIQASAQEAVATTNKSADTQVAGINANAQIQTSLNSLTGTEYSSDKQLTGIEYAADAETHRLEESLAFAQDKWNQVWPLLQGYLANPNQGSGSVASTMWSNLTAALGAAPWITQYGVWTPSQIQSQLNALYARADSKAQTLFHDSQIDLAGRGFGGSSPLLDMLQFSYEAENIQSSTEGAQQIALQSAQSNSDQLLAQQKQRQEQYIRNEQIFAELNRIATELATGVLSSTAQIISASVR